MEKIFLFIFLLSVQIAYGQVTEQTNNKSAQKLFDYHTLKQKKNKTTVWILLGSGIAMTIDGFTMDKNYLKICCFKLLSTDNTIHF